MALSVNSNICPQNHRCPLIRICPLDAISQDGFGLPIIDEKKCIECGKCIRYCPLRAVQ